MDFSTEDKEKRRKKKSCVSPLISPIPLVPLVTNRWVHREAGESFFLSFRKSNSCLRLPTSSHGILSSVFTLKYVSSVMCRARTRVPGAGAWLKESVSTGSHGKKACTHCDDRGWTRGDPFCGQILTDVETAGSCLTIPVSTSISKGFLEKHGIRWSRWSLPSYPPCAMLLNVFCDYRNMNWNIAIEFLDNYF